MTLIDPTHLVDLGYWPERRPRREQPPRPFKLAERPQPEPLPPAPLTVLPALLEIADPVPAPQGLRITFYAEHQPLATPEPAPGEHWDSNA